MGADGRQKNSKLLQLQNQEACLCVIQHAASTCHHESTTHLPGNLKRLLDEKSTAVLPQLGVLRNKLPLLSQEYTSVVKYDLSGHLAVGLRSRNQAAWHIALARPVWLR
jgi:hypothetical protein